MNNWEAILLVEDDVVDTMSVKRALRELKVPNPLFHVENGEEALAWLRDTKNPRPAIILLDLNMPRMNGHEFLAIIKKDEELRRIPVIVLTTSQAEADKSQSYDRGVAGYMIKTLDYPQFVEVMKTIHQYWTMSELPG
jgi:CheY-like chemotaxis protein